MLVQLSGALYMLKPQHPAMQGRYRMRSVCMVRPGKFRARGPRA